MTKEEKTEELAVRLFKTYCAVHCLPYNMGRSTPQEPLGYKTTVAQWRAMAAAAIDWMEKDDNA